jgi:glycosyltransferase involved in cell wall biosynthesis
LDTNNKKIKILFDASILKAYYKKNSSRSGIYNVVKNLLYEFSLRDDIEIFLYSKPLCYFDIKNLLQIGEIPSNCTLLDEEWIISPLLRKLFELQSKKVSNNYCLLCKICRFILFRLIRVYKSFGQNNSRLRENLYRFDIYFSGCDKIPQVISNNTQIKSFLLLHDVIPLAIPNVYKKLNFSKQWIERLVASLDTKSKYFAVSEYTKQDVLKFTDKIGQDDIVVTPLAASDKFFYKKDEEKLASTKLKYNIPKDKKYFLSLCTLEPRKNLLFAVDNFISFIEKNNIKDTVLVLAGAVWKEFDKIVRDKLNQYNSELIIKTGYVDDEDLQILYSSAEVFIFPSLYEGFGLPVLEAMQCGCPVITSNVTSLPEVIGDAGIQITPTSNEEMISAYERMYFDENFRQSCITKGLERAKSFSWKRCADKIVETIKESLEE